MNKKHVFLIFLMCSFACLKPLSAQSTAKTIFGKVFLDSIPNCTLDTPEKGLINWKLRLIRPTDTIFTTTDENGNYQFPKSINGVYNVQVFSESHYWQPCDLTKTFATSVSTETKANFGVKKITKCPFLQTNIVAPTLVKGQEANYFINYSNKGTADANNAYIDMEFDQFLSIIAPSISFQNIGTNRLRFQLGTIKAGTSATFSVKVKLQNDVATGLSHCVEAHIYPDNLCSSLSSYLANVNGACNNGKTEFALQRAVNKNTNIITKIKIFEDNTIVKNTNDTLKNNNMNTIPIIPFKKWHVYSTQIYFDNGSLIGKSVQQCDGLDTKGYLLQFTQEDGNPFTSVVCSQNKVAIRAIEKTALPFGRKNQHYIEQNEAIEYQVRFQNIVLNDTVKTVIIKDTIDNALDLTTLVMGAASHSYTWSLSGKNELKITMNNVALPDSSKSKLTSQGFISYKINQKRNNQSGTLIRSKASILLGTQAKKQINTVFHTIEKPSVVTSGTLTICEGETVPNLTETFNFPAYDSIVQYTLNVLPVKKQVSRK